MQEHGIMILVHSIWFIQYSYKMTVWLTGNAIFLAHYFWDIPITKGSKKLISTYTNIIKNNTMSITRIIMWLYTQQPCMIDFWWEQRGMSDKRKKAQATKQRSQNDECTTAPTNWPTTIEVISENNVNPQANKFGKTSTFKHYLQVVRKPTWNLRENVNIGRHRHGGVRRESDPFSNGISH